MTAWPFEPLKMFGYDYAFQSSVGVQAMNEIKNASMLEIGKAAEHLVVADLILSGYRAFLSSQGLPFDVIIEVEDGLLRVQVKSSLSEKALSKRPNRSGYIFRVRKRGKFGRGQRLDETHADLVALVALDIRAIAYLPLIEVGQTCELMPPGFQFTGRFARAPLTIDQLPIQRALDRLRSGIDVPQRAIRLLSVNEEQKSIADWARVSGIPENAIRLRLGRGWSAKDAVFEPLLETWSRKSREQPHG